MPRESDHLKQVRYINNLLRTAKDDLAKSRYDALQRPSGDEIQLTNKQVREFQERLIKADPNYTPDPFYTDSEEVKRQKYFEQVRESRANAEARSKALEDAAYQRKYGTPPPQERITQSAYQDQVAKTNAEINREYEARKTTRELKRSQATEAAKVGKKYNTTPIESSEFSRTENAKYQELQRNYDIRKAEYNRNLVDAARLKLEAAANPTAPKPRFSKGSTNPFTGKPWAKPPGKPLFSRGSHNPLTGKPWAKPKPSTSPGGGGVDEMVQKVQRNITQRFNAVKQTLSNQQQIGERTSKAASPTGTAVLQRPGAEIPHMAVGASVTGMTLSSRAIAVASNGAALNSGVGAAVSFGIQVASGVNPLKAVFSSVGFGLGSFTGQVAGTILTAPFFGGIAGGLVGGTLGGIAGQSIGDSLYNAIFGRSQKAVKPKPKTEAPPFTGGQQPNIFYDVHLRQARNPNTNYTESNNALMYTLSGSIMGLYTGNPDGIYILHNSGKDKFFIYSTTGQPKAATVENTGMIIEKVERSDGQPDTGGNIGGALPTPNAQALTPATIQSSAYFPPASYLPASRVNPTTAPSAVPSLKTVTPPPADLRNESHKRTPHKISLPAGKAITLTTPDGNSVTVAASPTPRVINIPRPLPRQLGSSEPETIAPLPVTISSPNAAPIVLSSPGSGSVTVSVPGQEPYTFNPASPHNAPLPISTIKPINRNEPVVLNSTILGTTTPTTTSPTTPTTTTPTTPSPTAPATQGDLNDLLLPLGVIGGLAGLGFLIKQIHDRTSPQALETAAAAGTCRTTQPGGCSSNLANSTGDRKNQDLLEKLGASAAQGAELGILNVINNKLGSQMPDGLSGGFGRLSKFLGIDRALNLLNFLVLLHNASMLTSSLKITLLETLSSIGNATGLLQTSENDNVDLNQVFNKGVEGFVVQLIGEDAWASMKVTWRKYSPIYRAASNSLSAVGNMFSSLGNGIEVIGERTGKIGNSLRAAGVVRENAYNFMSEHMNVHTNKFMTFQTSLGNTLEVVEAINEVAESVIEGQEGYTEAVRATDAFKKSLADANKDSEKKDGDNLAVKAEAEKIKANLVKDPTGEDETGLLSFLTDL